MTATPARFRSGRLDAAGVPQAIVLLETDFGRLQPPQWDPRHHFLLDALDRGEHHRFVVWPVHEPVAVLYVGTTGTAVSAGDVAAAPALAQAAERAHWRILIGDRPLAEAILDATQRGLFRRRASARTQRFMLADRASVPPAPSVPGFRTATEADLDRVTEFACRLHVEDQMGSAVSPAARQSVRSRMADSIAHGASYVVERGGTAVAKADLAVHSYRRGAQVAGVYVEERWRGRGLGSAMITRLCNDLLDAGAPVVSLHVRADNQPALRAYARAGFIDRGAWLLALR